MAEYTPANLDNRQETEILKDYEALFKRNIAVTVFIVVAFIATILVGDWQYPRVIYGISCIIGIIYVSLMMYLAHVKYYDFNHAYHAKWAATLITVDAIFTPQLFVMASWMV